MTDIKTQKKLFANHNYMDAHCQLSGSWRILAVIPFLLVDLFWSAALTFTFVKKLKTVNFHLCVYFVCTLCAFVCVCACVFVFPFFSPFFLYCELYCVFFVVMFCPCFVYLKTIKNKNKNKNTKRMKIKKVIHDTTAVNLSLEIQQMAQKLSILVCVAVGTSWLFVFGFYWWLPMSCGMLKYILLFFVFKYFGCVCLCVYV